MLIPAILKKDELEKLFAQYVYTDEYFYYTGYCYSHGLPQIEIKDNHYQFAIVDDDEVIGYLAYTIDPMNDTVYNFGLYSFDKGNWTIGIDLIKELNKLVKRHRRIEWRMVGGNPVKRHYDKFCERYGGRCVVLHKVAKAPEGGYRDNYIYEIVKGNKIDE